MTGPLSLVWLCRVSQDCHNRHDERSNRCKKKLDRVAHQNGPFVFDSLYLGGEFIFSSFVRCCYSFCFLLGHDVFTANRIEDGVSVELSCALYLIRCESYKC